jgi:glycosyltransferase involved in cell wall biosynthesis
MRIAHIITRMIIGGAQENTLLNCQGLIEQFGDDVLLITGPERGPEGDLLSRPTGIQVPTHYIPALGRAIQPWKDWQAYRDLQRELREFKPEVVHTHSAKAGILGRLAAWSLAIPLVVHTVHGAPFYEQQSHFAHWFYQQCERYAAKRCHHMISVADAMTELMVQAKVAPREKFTTIYSGMQIEPFLHANDERSATRAALGYTPEDVVIGTVARLSPLKGHADILLAAAELASQHRHARFLWVGDGSLRTSLEQQIRQLGLQDRMQCVGLVEPAAIPSYLGAMDLLVHTSWREGLARALPQALLAGKPIVSYDLDGAREVCQPQYGGQLIPPGDRPALVRAISTLISQGESRTQHAAAARAFCQARFDHREMTRQIRNLYEEQLRCSALQTS